MLITLEYIKRTVNEIDQCDDNEKAHAMEDKLHQDVLEWIATRPVLRDGELGVRTFSTRVLAAEAIKTKDIDFDRWCA